MRRFTSLFFLLLSLALLVGCRGPSLTGGFDTSQVFLWVVFGLIAALVLMGLFYAIVYAERRWRIVRLLRLKSLLRRIPGMEKYFAQGMVLQRGGRQAASTWRLLKRYSSDFTVDEQVNGGTGERMGKEKGKSVGMKDGGGRDGVREGDDLAGAKGGVAVVLPAVAVAEGGTTAVAPYPPQVGRAPVPAEFMVDLTADTNEMGDLAGRRIDRYQVDSLLVEGQMSRIYQAYDLKMARPVALKVFRPEVVADETRRDSLLQDIRAGAMLSHPHLVHIYDYGMAQNQLFLVSEFVNGSPINEYIDHLHEQKWHIALSHLLQMMVEACRALGQAHQLGIVHGGLLMRRILVEPQAVSVQEGEALPLTVKLGNIGLTSLYGGLDGVGAERWGYLSPEQCRGEVGDARSDVYALGVILYRLTVKRLPFAAESLAEARVQHEHELPVPPSKLRPGYPLKLEEVILRALAKAPEERFADANALANALAEVSEMVQRQGEEAYVLYAGEQVLRVSVAGEPPRTERLDRSPLFVGAGGDNDVILPGRGVSEYHMRLERSGEGWQVIDLGSETGTFLEDASLIPELPEVWAAGQTVVVGPYFLSWEEVAETRRDEVRTAEGEQLVGVGVLPMMLEVAPGEWGSLQISLMNQGLHVDHFHVEVGGLPPEWVQISNNNVQLLPGNQTYLLLTISPPNSSAARAGLHECEVRVHPVAYPEAVASVMVEVWVKEAARLFSDLHPVQLTNSGVTTLGVENGGNLAVAYAVRGRDAGDALLFELPEGGLGLVPGAKNELAVTVKPKKRPWFGTSQQFPFELLVTNPQGETRIERGQLQVNPRIPIWLMSLLGLLGILLCAALLYGTTYVDSQNQQATAVAIANETAIPATPTRGPTRTAVVSAPRSCADLFLQSSEDVAGVYTIYLNGDVNLPLDVYCDVGGGTYLELIGNGGSANFSTTVIDGEALTTQYERVRLDVRTLTIDRTDRTFAVVSGALPEDMVRLNAPDFGVAMGCSVEGTAVAEGQANINLTGTNLALAETVSFGLHGPYDVEVSQIIVADGRQVVDLQVRGQCGWIWPEGILQLVYIGEG